MSYHENQWYNNKKAALQQVSGVFKIDIAERGAYTARIQAYYERMKERLEKLIREEKKEKVGAYVFSKDILT